MSTHRRDRFGHVSRALASYDDCGLGELVTRVPISNVGVGGDSGVIEVDGIPVFVKRVPLTDRELAHPHSTVNLFDLPMFCQYGIGGPAFNAWRELAANRIVTDMVLSGETEPFPLLYHWRVLPGRAAVSAEHVDINATVAALDDSSAVRARLEALAEASSSLVLFSEYIHSPMRSWLADDSATKADMVERQLAEIVEALFGLATSPRFDLTAAERDFAERNATHDADYAAMRLVNCW